MAQGLVHGQIGASNFVRHVNCKSGSRWKLCDWKFLGRHQLDERVFDDQILQFPQACPPPEVFSDWIEKSRASEAGPSVRLFMDKAHDVN